MGLKLKKEGANPFQPAQSRMQNMMFWINDMEGTDMIINHNMSSLYADRVLGISNDGIMKNIEKLSSGEKITVLAMMLQDLLFLKKCVPRFAV